MGQSGSDAPVVGTCVYTHTNGNGNLVSYWTDPFIGMSTSIVLIPLLCTLLIKRMQTRKCSRVVYVESFMSSTTVCHRMSACSFCVHLQIRTYVHETYAHMMLRPYSHIVWYLMVPLLILLSKLQHFYHITPCTSHLCVLFRPWPHALPPTLNSLTVVTFTWGGLMLPRCSTTLFLSVNTITRVASSLLSAMKWFWSLHACLQFERLDADLKSYRNNSLKESIRCVCVWWSRFLQ